MAPKFRPRRRLRRERLSNDNDDSDENSDEEDKENDSEEGETTEPSDDPVLFGLEAGQLCGRGDCYRALCPIGEGGWTKTWLCVDEREANSPKAHSSTIDSKLVAVKVCGLSLSDSAVEMAKHEVGILTKLGQGPGSEHVCRLISHFWFESPHGRNFCRAYELLDVTVNDVLDLFAPEALPCELMKKNAADVLSGLAFIHSQNVRHGAIQASNVLIDRRDWNFLKNAVDAAWGILRQGQTSKHTSKEKVTGGRRHRKSSESDCGQNELEEIRALRSTFEDRLVLDMGKLAQIHVKLIDFEGALPIRPVRTPEIIMDMPSHLKGDCWSAACLFFQLTTQSHLFDLERCDDDVPLSDLAAKASRDERHLKLMVLALGSFPPKTWALTGKRSHKFFDTSFTGFRNLTQPSQSQMQGLSDALFFASSLSVNDAKIVIGFLTALLKWQPSARQSARVALHHEWLTAFAKVENFPIETPEQDAQTRNCNHKEVSKNDWEERVAERIEVLVQVEKDMEIIATDQRQQERRAQEEERQSRHHAAEVERKRKLAEKMARQAAEEELRRKQETQRREEEENKKKSELERERRKREEFEERKRVEAEKRKAMKEEKVAKRDAGTVAKSMDPTKLVQDSDDKTSSASKKSPSHNSKCKNDKLTYAGLGLSDNDVSNVYVSEVALSASEVDFSQNCLSAKGMLRVVEICAQCKHLQILKLYKNDIDDNAVAAIDDILMSCRKLRELHLSNNRLTNKGVAAIIHSACKWRPEGTVPLWLRLENNLVVAKSLVSLLSKTAVNVCPRSPQCTQFMCCFGAKVHIPFLLGLEECSKLRERKSSDIASSRSPTLATHFLPEAAPRGLETDRCKSQEYRHDSVGRLSTEAKTNTQVTSTLKDKRREEHQISASPLSPAAAPFFPIVDNRSIPQSSEDFHTISSFGWANNTQTVDIACQGANEKEDEQLHDRSLDTLDTIQAKVLSEVPSSENGSVDEPKGRGQMVHHAIASYSGEASGYLSVSAGDLILIKRWEPSIGDKGCKFSEYVFGQKLIDHSAGWFPVDVVAISQWERFLDDGGVPWLYNSQSGSWKWQTEMHKPCRRWGMHRETDEESEQVPAPALKKGDRVKVFGLVSAKGMHANGKHGEVMSFDDKALRWRVTMSEPIDGSCVCSLAAKNLMRLPD